MGTYSSTAAPVRWGVPQVSVLGPLLYVLCTTDAAGIVTSFGLGVHLYADNTQLHGSCLASDAEALSWLVLRFIETVRLWMASNRLRLNPDKTQFIWFGTKLQLVKRNCDRLSSVSLTLVSDTHVRNLGVILDSELLMGTTSHSYIYVAPVYPAASSACDSPLSHAEISCLRTASSVTGLTTATVSSTVPASSNSIVFNPSWTQRRGSSWGYRSTPISRPAFKTSFIGSQFASGLSSRSASSFKIAWSALPRLTSKNSASEFPQTPAVATFLSASRADLVVPRADTTWFGRRGFLCLVRPSGIPYRKRFDKPWTMLNSSRES